jgi:hypothetical protein
MDRKAQSEEDRRLGQIHNRDRPRAGEESAHLVEVAQGLLRLAGMARLQAEPHHGPVHGRIKMMI